MSYNYNIVYVSNREKNKLVFRLLKMLNVKYQLIEAGTEMSSAEQVCGDYFIGDIVIELKSSYDDYLSSITTNRMNNQAVNLSANLENSYIFVIGDIASSVKMHNYNLERVVAGLMKLSLQRSSMGVMGSNNVFTFPTLLEFSFALKYLQKYANNHAPREPKAPKMTNFVNQPLYSIPFMVQQTPSVKKVITNNLLNHFGTIEAIVNASVNELKKVDKIGKITAETIYSFYRKDWRDYLYNNPNVSVMEIE